MFNNTMFESVQARKIILVLSCGKLFQVLTMTICSAKNVALAVQQECGLSILYGAI